MSGHRRRVRIERTGSGAVPLAAMREREVGAFPWIKVTLAMLLGLGGLVFGALALLDAVIDPAALKQQAEAALRRTTGREVRIEGPLAVTSRLGATVTIDDVVVPDRPGSGREPMLRIARVEAEVSLLGLLAGRLDIERLVVVQPELTLEVGADGGFNWLNPPAEGVAATPVLLPRHIHIKDGRVVLQDARSNRSAVVIIRRLTASEADAMGQATVAGDLVAADQRIALSGHIGPLARLFDRTSQTPWNLRLALDVQGARFAAAGSFTRPQELAGYQLKLDASASDGSVLAPLFAGRLPQLRTLVATARIADSGRALPDISGVRLQLGASDLSALVPGLKVEALEVTMPALEQSLRGELLGTLNAVPVRMQIGLGGLAAFLPDPPPGDAPFPIDFAAEIGETRLTVKGRIADPRGRRGLELQVAGRVRDLDLLSPLAGRRLPELRNLAFEARLGDGAGGFAETVAVSGLTLTAPQGDLAGDLVVRVAGRPGLSGALRSGSLDADALQVLLAPYLGPLDIAEPGPVGRPRDAARTHALSDAPLRLGALETVEIDLSLAIAEFRALGVPFRDLTGRVQAGQGRLALDSLTATMPDGRAALHLTVDGRARPPAVGLRAVVPGIPLPALLGAVSRRDNLFGDLEIDADLTARGGSLRALAGSLGGHLGLAVVEGDADSRLLLDPLTEVLRAARLPVTLPTLRNSLVRLRCFAARLEARDGRARVDTLALESGPITIQGGGAIDLGAERWDVRLRPQLRFAGPTVAVPVALEGTFLAPRLRVEGEASVTRPPQRPATEMPELCPPALTAARNGRSGPMPGEVDARASLVRPGAGQPARR